MLPFNKHSGAVFSAEGMHALTISNRLGTLLVALGLIAACGGASTTPTGPSKPAAGTIYSQANVRLEQTALLDLDTGALPLNTGTGADVWFESVNAQERYLTAVDGATIAIYGQTEPGFTGCINTALSTVRIPIGSLTTGSYVCAATSEGRIAEILIVQPAGPSGPTAALTLYYTTYNR